MKKLVFKIFNKVYRVQFVARNSSQVRYVALRRWEQFDENELITILAQDHKVKPEHIQIKSIERM